MCDECSKKVKDTLATRVGFRSRLPDCHSTTAGPHSDPAKVVDLGVACDITAVSKGGPRYEAGLSPEQGMAHANGIWLPQTHAKLVENDADRYAVQTLRSWKATAEEMIRQEVVAVSHQSRQVIATGGRLRAILLDASARLDRLSEVGAWEMPNEIAGEVACQLEHRINDGVKDALELKAKLTSAMASGRPRVRGNGEQQAGEG